MPKYKTADYKAVEDSGGHRFMFYCQVSTAHVCTTKQIYPGEVEKALLEAWQAEGRRSFNQCSRCGKWVIDAVFNAEVLECVECAPYEAEPKFCKTCGAKIESPVKHCQHCGNKLLYEGGEEDHDTEASV